MKKLNQEQIYEHFIEDYMQNIQNNEYLQYFLRCIRTGRNQAGLTHRSIEMKMETDWLSIIEDTIIPLDNIIRNPNRYIKNIEEVVPIEVARGITTESIKHLARHTSLIAEVDKDDNVTPNKILNVIKEESFDTYENRFIYTLLINLEYFLDKRMRSIVGDNKEVNEFVLQGESLFGKERLNYKMSFKIESRLKGKEATLDELINQDISKLNATQRIARLQRIVYSFKGTQLIKDLVDCVQVRPPLTLTNVLTKNPNFIKAVELWNFLSRYKEEKLEASIKESTIMPDNDYLNKMYTLLPIQYLMLKQNIEGELVEAKELRNEEKESKVLPIKEQIEQFVDELNIDVSEIRTIFNDLITKRKRKKILERARINNIIKRVLEVEKMRLDREKIRLEKLEKQKKAKAKLLQEKLKKQRALERAKVSRIHEREVEKQKRLKEKERLQLEAAKRREKMRLNRIEAAKKEKERLEAKKLKEKEALKAKKIKLQEEEKAQKQKAKAKVKKEKAKEQSLLAKQKELDKAKAMAKKQKDLEKVKKQKELDKEKAKAKKEKDALKAKEQAKKLKEQSKEKEALKKEKEALKAKLQRKQDKEKQKAKEQAKIEKLKAIERQKKIDGKEKAKSKELAQLKKQKELDKEKAKAKKEKEALKTKELVKKQKEHDKAKAQAKKQKETLKAKEKSRLQKQLAKEKQKAKTLKVRNRK